MNLGTDFWLTWREVTDMTRPMFWEVSPEAAMKTLQDLREKSIAVDPEFIQACHDVISGKKLPAKRLGRWDLFKKDWAVRYPKVDVSWVKFSGFDREVFIEGVPNG